MSAADWNEYGFLVPALFGKPLQVTGVTNSLKFRADPNDQRKTYLWIDPPWELLKNGRLIADSFEYPHHEDADYDQRHNAWAERVSPLLQGAMLLDVHAEPGGSTLFRFTGDVIVKVAATESRAVDRQWYDDWYAKE